MKLSDETKLFIGIGIAILLFVVGGAFLFSRPPKPISRERLIPGDTFVKGVTQSGTVLVEFSDFQCPACLAFKSAVDELILKYPDSLLFAYRHYPLPQHEFGFPAALAAESAGEQGKFWEMYDFLFDNQARLSKDVVMEGVERLGLNKEQFEEDFSNETYKEKVQRDQLEGNSLVLKGTPSFFLNGVKINPATPEELKTAVERSIK